MTYGRKRRTYLLDRSFQLGYAAVLGGWGLLVALLFGLLIWKAHRYGPDVLAWAVPVLALVSAGALAVVGFRMSQRIAGPVHVIGRDLRLLAQGHFPEQRSLRKKDELKQLFVLFRHAVEALRQREEGRTELLEEVLRAMREAEARAPKDPQYAQLRATIERVDAEVRDRRAALKEAAER